MASLENMSGEQLAQLAYSEPPLEPHGLARGVEIYMYFAAIITTIIVGLRVYVRAFMNEGRAWGPDDYLAVLGYVSSPKPLGSLRKTKTSFVWLLTGCDSAPLYPHDRFRH